MEGIKKTNDKQKSNTSNKKYVTPTILDEKYWLAFFFGAIISSILILYFLPYLAENVNTIIKIVAWVTIILAIVFLFITIYKEGVFKFFLGFSKTDLEDIQDTGESLLINTQHKDWNKASEDLKVITKKGVAWYSWKNYRIWVLSLFNTLFLAFIGLFGSILLYKQNQLLEIQNSKIDLQNEMFKVQNGKMNIQNNLMEAERTSSLIHLMSNILDKVDEEIKTEKRLKSSNNKKYSLSNPLIARIEALSKAFRPYQLLESDTLKKRLVSPERGQLFIALLGNSLDEATQNAIMQKGDFSNATIRNVKLNNSNITGVNLTRADLTGADFSNSKLRNGDLSGTILNSAKFVNSTLYEMVMDVIRSFGLDLTDAELTSISFFGADLKLAQFENAQLKSINFDEANLWRSNFSFAVLNDVRFYETTILKEAVFRGVTFVNTSGLSFDNLKDVNSLYQSRNLPEELKARLMKERPCLFTEKGCIPKYIQEIINNK